MKRALISLLAGGALLLHAPLALGAEVNLRVHHFMSSKATLHQQFLLPLAQRLEQKSGGRIQMKVFDSMSLGGRPTDLYDQVADGAVDVVLTLPGYTPGRFNRTEVFELPFITDDTVAASKAFWDLVASDLQEGEYEETQILTAWVHGPGVIHSKEPILKLEDLKGKEVRGPTRVVTDMLGILGATPAGMPLPQIPEALSKGVINGVLLPWDITPTIRLAELVHYHTEFGGPVLYTATFVLAMNREVYEEMPPDLRAILDAETGKNLAAEVGVLTAEADAVGRKFAEGNTIYQLDKKEVARWIKVSHALYDRWAASSAERGFDGAATLEQAQRLIAANR